ncbi:hypothetical protein K501DRAFT_267771 [Backusella circina FSU 941]|nr:hypothetical protein K501DRAFT_267771 [Backusella circina FSU 941]
MHLDTDHDVEKLYEKSLFLEPRNVESKNLAKEVENLKSANNNLPNSLKNTQGENNMLREKLNNVPSLLATNSATPNKDRRVLGRGVTKKEFDATRDRISLIKIFDVINTIKKEFDISPQTTYNNTDSQAKKKAIGVLEEIAAPYMPLRACLDPRKKTCDVAVQTESAPVIVGVQTVEKNSTANSVEISNSESSSDSEEGESDSGNDLNEQFKDTRSLLKKSIATEKRMREKTHFASHRKQSIVGQVRVARKEK